jgi:hypothetical protein
MLMSTVVSMDAEADEEGSDEDEEGSDEDEDEEGRTARHLFRWLLLMMRGVL